MGGLPAQAFLSLGFFVQYILLSMHEKHGLMDTTVHKLIGMTAFSGASRVNVGRLPPRSACMQTCLSLLCCDM